MGKHQRKRRRKARPPREIQKFAGVYLAQHPFNALDKAKLREALSNIGEDAVEKFDTLVAELQHILDSVDALQAIACLVTYCFVRPSISVASAACVSTQSRSAALLRQPSSQRSGFQVLAEAGAGAVVGAREDSIEYAVARHGTEV